MPETVGSAARRPAPTVNSVSNSTTAIRLTPIVLPWDARLQRKCHGDSPLLDWLACCSPEGREFPPDQNRRVEATVAARARAVSKAGHRCTRRVCDCGGRHVWRRAVAARLAAQRAARPRRAPPHGRDGPGDG